MKSQHRLRWWRQQTISWVNGDFRSSSLYCVILRHYRPQRVKNYHNETQQSMDCVHFVAIWCCLVNDVAPAWHCTYLLVEVVVVVSTVRFVTNGSVAVVVSSSNIYHCCCYCLLSLPWSLLPSSSLVSLLSIWQAISPARCRFQPVRRGAALRRNWSGRCLRRQHQSRVHLRADSRFAPSQWETSLQSNAVYHWLGVNLESALLDTEILGMSGLIYVFFESVELPWNTMLQISPALKNQWSEHLACSLALKKHPYI